MEDKYQRNVHSIQDYRETMGFEAPYMTGTLEHQIEKILKDEVPSADLGAGKTILDHAIEKLVMLFRERERLRSGGTANENTELHRELAEALNYIDRLEAALYVINTLAQFEDSKLMNTITTITDVFTQEEE